MIVLAGENRMRIFFHGFTVYSNLHTLTEDGVEWGEVGQQGSY